MSKNDPPSDDGGITTTLREPVSAAAPEPAGQGTSARTQTLMLHFDTPAGIGTSLKLNPPRVVTRVETTKEEGGTIHLTFHES